MQTLQKKIKKHKLHLTANQTEIQKLNSLRATLLRLFSFLMWRKDDIENENPISDKALPCILKSYMQNINTYSIVYDYINYFHTYRISIHISLCMMT